MGRTTQQIVVLKLGLSFPVAAWARSEGEPQSHTKTKKKPKESFFNSVVSFKEEKF